MCSKNLSEETNFQGFNSLALSPPAFYTVTQLHADGVSARENE
jgi:hypothetical protein